MNVNIKYICRRLQVLSTATIFFLISLHGALHAELVLADVMKDIPLADSILLYEDPGGGLTLDDISRKTDADFKHLSGGAVNMGYSESVFWFRLTVVNHSGSTKKWIFESQYPLLDYISIYIPTPFGYNVIHSGDRQSFSTMPFGFYNFISDVSSPPGISILYIKIKSQGSIIAKFRAWDPFSFINYVFMSASLLWLFYGVMIALLLYCLFIFISTWDKVYIALGSFIFSSLMVTFVHNGMAKKYLWPDMQWWGNYCHPFFIFLAIATMIWFTKLYFNTGFNLPGSNRRMNVLLYLSIGMSLSIFFMPYSFATKLSVVMTGIVSTYLIFFVLLPMTTINRRLSIYYICSWFLFTIGDILLGLRSYGLIDETFIAAWSYQISLTLGIVFFSVGVADKLNTLRRDNEQVLKTLKESEERYRLFFETAHDAIVFFINDIPAYANMNMITISGFAETEFYSKRLTDFFTDTDPLGTDIHDIIYRLSSGRMNNCRFEHFLTRKNGEKLSVLVSLSAISAGIHKGILMVLSDISSLKKADIKIKEQYREIQDQLTKVETLNLDLISAQDKLVEANSELEKEKEYLAATLTSIGDGVISYDTEGKIFLINRVAEELTGIKSSEAIGRNIRDILKLDDETSKELLFETLGTVREKFNFNNIGVPFKLYDNEGNERIIELNSSLIKLHDRPIGIVLALRDTTIKSRIDSELIKMSKLESIGILAGGIAHDFNNLLTGISANISLLKKTENIPSGISDLVLEINKAVERATALTKQLLTFAKGGTPVIKPHRIDEIIKESLKFIIKSDFIKIELDVEDGLPSAMIDLNQMSQAINNLLINSVQAMPDGGNITISLKNISDLPPELPLKSGTFILLTISDTGCGISKKNISKIFDPFFTTKPSGTGFGLTSTYSIIKKHRGYIRVNSVENQGTTFQIYLRASDEKPDSENRKLQSPLVSPGGSVLIMDDEDYILEVLVKMLRYHGCSVSTAKNGEEAIALYKKKFEDGNPFNYVILDLTVYNGMGGRETIGILRDIDPGIKAIVSSGYSDNPVIANFREYGFTGILSKPYVLDDVLNALRIS